MTTEKKKTIAALFGYGLDPEKIEPLLDKLVEEILNGKVKAVIASGGCTSRARNPGVSEAAVIFGCLCKKLHGNDKGKGYELVPKSWVGGYCSPCDLEKMMVICKDCSHKEGEELKKIDFYFEDCARTTRENIQFMKNLLKKYKVWEDYELVTYCDKAYRIKIAALAICVWHYLPRAVTYTITGRIEHLKQLLVYTIPTVLALKIAFLRKLEDARREKQMDNN